MPKITIKRDNVTIEADVTFDQLKELVGVNHNGHVEAQPSLPIMEHDQPSRRIRMVATINDFERLWNRLSENAKRFITVIRSYPDGIEATELAPLLGLKTANQIGGLTGPGISKIAEKFGIKAEDIYRSQVIFPGGVRKRMFYPGRLVLQTNPEAVFIGG